MLFNLTVVDTQPNPYCQGSVFQPQTWVRSQEKRRDFGLTRQMRLERKAWGWGCCGQEQGQDPAWEGQGQGDPAVLRARGKPGRGAEGLWRPSWGPAHAWEGPRASRWPENS